MAIDRIFNDANVDGIADNIFGAVNNSVSEVKQMQQRKAAENVQMVVEAFKKIETNITEKFDNVTDVIEKRVLTIKDGRDGSSGSDGRNGRDGKPGRDGVNGKQGTPGAPGKDGVDGVDGVSVTDASIDFDGSLVISLSTGQQINVGEIAPPELERQLVELRQGGGSAGSSGDVAGPTASTDNAIVRFDGTTGKLVQNSVVTIADTTGNMAGVGTLGVGAITTTGALVGTATQNAFNTVSTTLNLGGAATAVNVGAATGTLTVANTTLAAKAITASTTLGVTGATTLSAALTYGGVTLTNAVTGTGKMVLDTSPTLVTPALGSPSSVGTMPAFTLGGTVSGGGNQINNVVIGTTTPLAGAFTTLSATNTITAIGSIFKANGAPSLIAATAGEAILAPESSFGALLYGRGTTYDVVLGQRSTAVALGVLAGSVNLFAGGTLSVTGTLSGGTSGTAYSFSGSAPATSLTLDSSGNLGIGTSSPTYKLHIVGGNASGFLLDNGGQQYTQLLIQRNGAVNTGGDILVDGTSSTFSIRSLLAGPMLFSTSAIAGSPTERARIDSAGNLGLGVTPSAWGSGYIAFQLAAGSFSGNAGAIGFEQNAFQNGSNWIYRSNGAASHYETYGGAHYFFTAASGTAGNAISFTQAMTLDANGRLGVGTTSPSSYGGFISVDIRGSNGGQLIVANSAATNIGELLTDGNGFNVTARTNNAMLFKTNDTERARIDSSGNLLVGTTDASSTAGIGFKFLSSATYSRTNQVGSTTLNTDTTHEVYSTGASAYRFYVGYGGTVFATSIVITAISDQRLKENVRDIDTGLSSIMALKPRRFDWKEGKGQDKKNVAGFIAQEFETVFPECVSTSLAGGDGIEYKNINHETLIPTLVKAMQEQQALITQLTARITALETA